MNAGCVGQAVYFLVALLPVVILSVFLPKYVVGLSEGQTG
jgi:hypothetical protein